jgi:hypothetical protein
MRGWHDMHASVLDRHRCLEFDGGKSYLSADLRIDCDSTRYHQMFAYSAVMVVVIPIGFPVGFFWALWRHRRSLYPMNRGRCLRVRHSSDSATPCIVACVEAHFSAAAREVLHDQLQHLGRALLCDAHSSPTAHGTVAPVTSSSGGACTTWSPAPGPGDPSLQHAGEPMFHYALPPTHTPAQSAAVDVVVAAWHLAPERYVVAVDVNARRDDPSIQHLSFLYEVRCYGCAPSGQATVSIRVIAFDRGRARVMTWRLLLQGYEPKFWYFEVVFLLLKLALSAFTVLFLPESVAQVRRVLSVHFLSTTFCVFLAHHSMCSDCLFPGSVR